jgi:hypothetical protein
MNQHTRRNAGASSAGVRNMKRYRLPALGLAGLGLGLACLSGCQTNVAGMTLPSAYYLQHPPQYFPESPPFPLPRELASQEVAAAAALEGGPPVPLPAAVPPAPRIAPPPAPLPPPVPPPIPPPPAG